MAGVACERRVETQELELRVLEWEGDAPAVLLVHATSFCADVWSPVWQEARAAGAPSLHAWALDQRGHGGSDAPQHAEAYGWSRLADDVEVTARALLSARPAAAPILVGHSSGATACLAAAARLPAVAAVVVIEPVLFDPPWPGTEADSFAGSRALAARSLRRRARFASRDEARAKLRQRFPYSGFAEESLEAFLDGGLRRDADGSWVLCCAPQHEAWAYQGAAELDVWPCIAALQAPVYRILAEHSAVPPGLAERLRRLAPGGREARVCGSTHFAPLERPREVGSLLAGFLRELAGC